MAFNELKTKIAETFMKSEQKPPTMVPSATSGMPSGKITSISNAGLNNPFTPTTPIPVTTVQSSPMSSPFQSVDTSNDEATELKKQKEKLKRVLDEVKFVLEKKAAQELKDFEDVYKLYETYSSKKLSQKDMLALNDIYKRYKTKKTTESEDSATGEFPSL